MIGIANGAGAIPEPYSTIVDIATVVIKITNIINDIELQTKPGGQFEFATLDIGTFDLTNSQGQDLRDIAASPDFGKFDKPNWSNLQDLQGIVSAAPRRPIRSP